MRRLERLPSPAGAHSEDFDRSHPDSQSFSLSGFESNTIPRIPDAAAVRGRLPVWNYTYLLWLHTYMYDLGQGSLQTETSALPPLSEAGCC